MFDLHKACRAERDTLADEVKYLRSQLRLSQERTDRLTEALARRDGAQLTLPIEPYSPYSSHPAPEDEAALIAEVAAQNRSVGEWVRAINGGHKISSPVKEDQVLAP